MFSLAGVFCFSSGLPSTSFFSCFHSLPLTFLLAAPSFLSNSLPCFYFKHNHLLLNVKFRDLNSPIPWLLSLQLLLPGQSQYKRQEFAQDLRIPLTKKICNNVYPTLLYSASILFVCVRKREKPYAHSCRTDSADHWETDATDCCFVVDFKWTCLFLPFAPKKENPNLSSMTCFFSLKRQLLFFCFLIDTYLTDKVVNNYNSRCGEGSKATSEILKKKKKKVFPMRTEWP